MVTLYIGIFLFEMVLGGTDLYSYLISTEPCQDFVHGDGKFKNVSVHNNVHENKFGNLWRIHKNVHMASWAVYENSRWQLMCFIHFYKTKSYIQFTC
jgi:hypothetical protein